MFSFFRRQSKNKGGGDKKSKKQSVECANELKSESLDKYPIKDTQTQHIYIPLNMGNSESSKKCSNESLDAGYQSDTSKLNNNYSPPISNLKNFEFRWDSNSPSKKSDNFNTYDNKKDTHTTEHFGTAPSSPVVEDISMLGEIPKSDSLPLARAKEAFFKSQPQSNTAPVNLSNVISLNTVKDLDVAKAEPPLAIQEDLDTNVNPSCDTNAQIKYSEPKLDQNVIEPKPNNVPNANVVLNVNCDNSSCAEARHIEDIRFADSDEDVEEQTNNHVEKINSTSTEANNRDSKESPSSSIYSNTTVDDEDEDEEYEESRSRQDELALVGDRGRKRSLRIPDITITESSDSEGENESDEDYQMLQYYPDPRYERAFPTILYDITEVDEPFSDASDMDPNCFNEVKHNFVQEPKFQEQIIESLQCEIESKDTENMQLKGRINDLQHDILNKAWGMDRLHTELASFQTEADCVRKKLLKVEDDLVRYKNKNMELNEELLKTLEKESSFKLVNELQSEIEELKSLIRNLQEENDVCQAEKQELQSKLLAIETEKKDRLKTMEMALDETLKQKQKLQAHFDGEYEKLRTVHSDREQQLVDDFEWKLREVEMKCKRKLEERDKLNEEKIKQIRKELESEMLKLKDQIKAVEKVKSYQAEVVQLRGLTEEQDRSLKMAMKTTDQLQTNQRCLNEEIEKLRASLEKERAHLATVQGIHSREIAEKDKKYSLKLGQQKDEINAQWEEKFRKESTRLTLELVRQHKDEKRTLLEDAKSRADQKLKDNDQMWNKKLTECKKELESLEKLLTANEKTYRQELVKLQTNTDSDMMELRRKLDKMDLSYQGQLEKKQEQHETELEKLREEYEKKIQQSEQNWSQQISSTRATLELVKEQLQRDAEAQVEELNKKFMIQLEQQYNRLVREKEEALAEVEEKYSHEMSELQNQLNEELKNQKLKETEMLNMIDNLKLELDNKTNNMNMLRQTHDAVENIVSDLRGKITVYDDLRKQAENTLKDKEVEHNDVLSKAKEKYENEIEQLRLKVATLERTTIKEQTKETLPLEPSPSTEPQQTTSNQSKSKRRNRGRHRNQKNQRPQLTHQFSL